ncbi:MAG: aldose 1-epimerase family protein [Oscillospiraceae bacterium]|nr:aldose 1-epimerase family protein [Oscillospiraceae bacterium]
MITIQNSFLKAKFNEVGAELKSLVCNDTEYIWNGDENFWKGSAPTLFPICSGLKDDKYLLDGVEYTLAKHGFAKQKTFELESKQEDSAVFLLKADTETLKQYPFNFEFRIAYELIGKKLKVTYKVTNKYTKKMYFSIGAHEAYNCPEGIEDYDICFPQNETLDSSMLVGNVLGDDTVRIIENEDKLALKYDYFAVDALVFKKLVSKSAVLKNRKTGRAVRLQFEEFPYFLLWTKPGAGYICMEPWCGISDSIHSKYDFVNKDGIETADVNETFTRVHSVEIL